MSNNSRMNFIELITRYEIEIPMLQRDYAYGRANESEKRKNFLENLKNYLKNGGHELDFIYGTVNGDKLILLDGQQRITTLFLLNWYLALKSGNYEDFKEKISKDGKSRFSYNTRNSSKDFCDYLIEKGGTIFENSKYNSISTCIKDDKDFLHHWSWDPTIDSMLNMLDDIYETFEDVDSEAYSNLNKLTFNFLNLADYKLTDDLYVKMNSRGKPLTRFENLKSKWLKLCDELDKLENVDKKTKIGLGKDDSLRSYVAKKLDQDWLDAFWSLKQEDIKKLENDEEFDTDIIDNMMLNFISVLAINYRILEKLDGEETKEISALMNAKSKELGNTISYSKLLDILNDDNGEFTFELIKCFDAFCKNRKWNYFTKDIPTFNEKDIIDTILDDHNKDMEYEKKVKFFALTKYLISDKKDNVDVNQWMRFACNVISNSYFIANSVNTYINGIAAINDMFDKNIIEKSSSDEIENYPSIDNLQINEELIKIELSKDKKWADLLILAENELQYFEGRLRYPLIDCANKEIDDFKTYLEKLRLIFGKKGCTCEKELIMAVLSKGDYTLGYKSNQSLLKNDARDNSWRRFLKEEQKTEGTDTDKRDYFKAVIDDDKFNPSIVKDSLKQIASAYIPEEKDWRWYLIQLLAKSNDFKFGEDFSFGNDRCIRFRDDEIDLLPGTAITGYHSELYTLYYYYQLKDAFKDDIKYYLKKTEGEKPYIEFKDSYKITCEDRNYFKISDKNGNEKESKVNFDNLESELEKL